jgi:hypothetical protein
MIVDGLPIPSELQRLIAVRKWPRDRDEAHQQNFKLLIPLQRIRKFAPEESSLYLNAPPFFTVRKLNEGAEHRFWASPNAAPSEISFTHSVVIGDFGLGSDAPILLDYRATINCPSVLRLRWSNDNGENHWVEIARSFEAFATLLGL